MTTTQISFAACVYDRLTPLFTGQVKIPGFELVCHPIDDPRKIFDRQRGVPEFDVSEMSLSEVLTRLSKGDRTFKALPIFPAKVFRHGYIVVDTDQIKSPRDLQGKHVGVQLYTMTAAVWMRHVLKEEYHVDLGGIHWLEGELDKPGFHGKPRSSTIKLPPTLRQNTDPDKSLDDLLLEGSINAVMGADLPPSLGKVDRIQRLFPDYVDQEKAYFKRTRIFPIMHVVVVRREQLVQHPQLERLLCTAFEQAKDMAMERMKDTSIVRYMLPWLAENLSEVEEVFGNDLWSYGVEDNRATLSTFARILYEDGLM